MAQKGAFLGYNSLLGDGSYVENRPSKWQRTLGILNEYNPIPAFERLMKSPMASGGPISDQNISDGLTVAGTVTGGSTFAPKPRNAVYIGYRAFKGMHGADEAGNAINLTKGRGQHSWDKGTIPNAGFFSSNPDVASYFADALTKKAKTVFPVEIEMENPLVIDGAGKHAADFQFGENKEQWDSYFSSPEYAQYDGVILKNVKDAGGVTDIYVPKKGNQISSKFQTKEGGW